MKTMKSNITELVEKARSGHDSSMNQLVDYFHKDIYRFIYYRTRSQVLAEDLTQDVFFKMFKNIKRLKDITKFKSWLYSIAVNRIKDHYRKKRVLEFFGASTDVDEMFQSEQSQDNPGTDLMNKEFMLNFSKLLKNLTQLEQEVFVLKCVEQFKIKEIAQTLNKSESTVKTYLYRAFKKLKQNNEFSELLTEVDYVSSLN